MITLALKYFFQLLPFATTNPPNTNTKSKAKVPNTFATT